MKTPSIHIIGGTGKMGQWLLHFFSSYNIPVTISGTDFLKHKKDIGAANIVIVSVPIAKTEEVLRKTIPLVNPTTLLADIASVKIIPMQVLEEASCATLGMHPLFGPTVGSVIGQKIIFCKQKDNAFVSFLKNLFEQAGIEIIEMSAEEHDYQVAYIQALTHAFHLLYAKTILGQEKEILTRLQTPTFAIHAFTMGRVLTQDIDMMADIQMYNPYFLPVFDSLFENTKMLFGILKKGDKKAFTDFFSHEVKMTKRFSDISLFQTNKLLHLLSESPVTLPTGKPQQDIRKDLSVAFLGPEGTYSQMAAKNIFPKAKKYVPTDSIYATFQAVMQNDADIGIVPAENSLEGVVRNTMDYLVEFSLFLSGSFLMPIHHNLLSKEKKLADITTVLSHPQALGQCKQWLHEKLPKAKIISTESTTQALTDLKKGYAYIASEQAAKTYTVPMLAQNIEDTVTNTTRFYVIAKNPLTVQGLSDKRTLLFVTVYNRVGILRDILDVLAKHDLNLLKLESRPSQEKVWDYHFFIEIEKSENDLELKKALKALEKYCPVVRILGRT